MDESDVNKYHASIPSLSSAGCGISDFADTLYSSYDWLASGNAQYRYQAH